MQEGDIGEKRYRWETTCWWENKHHAGGRTSTGEREKYNTGEKENTIQPRERQDRESNV